jgi:DNA-binding Lrp family transcriptional regulator
MNIQVDSLQARIVSILKDWYPITVEELKDELALPSGVLERSLKGLMVKGIIAFEPLSDKTFIRLLVPEIVIEVDSKGKKNRRKSRPVPPLPGEGSDDSIMYR